MDVLYDNPTEEDYKRWGEFLKGEQKRHFQDQASVTEQLMDLYHVGRKIGKYDACDFLNKLFAEWKVNTIPTKNLKTP